MIQKFFRNIKPFREKKSKFGKVIVFILPKQL